MSSFEQDTIELMRMASTASITGNLYKKHGMRDVRELRDMDLPVFCAGAAAPPSPATLMAIAIQQPIGGGGGGVFPGDLIVADEDAAAVVPAHLARETAEQASEKEKQDAWTRRKVAEGGGIRGRYPPDAAHREMYQRWRASQRS